jgi:hypothetical protein
MRLPTSAAGSAVRGFGVGAVHSCAERVQSLWIRFERAGIGNLQIPQGIIDPGAQSCIIRLIPGGSGDRVLRALGFSFLPRRKRNGILDPPPPPPYDLPYRDSDHRLLPYKYDQPPAACGKPQQ